MGQPIALLTRNNAKRVLTTREIVVFAMLGALMFATKKAMEALPNIHLLGMLTMAYTLTFRQKALIPLYLYVLLDGLCYGFGMAWIPYLYIWTLLWGVTMLLPRRMPPKRASVVYPLVCAAHGLLFGTLYAPAQILMMGMSLKAGLTWILYGLPFDALHAAGNFVFGFLVLPLSELLTKLMKSGGRA